jgi:hypothetical protein
MNYRKAETFGEKTQLEHNLAKLPEMCFVDLATEDVMCIVKRGESGYYKTDWPKGKFGAELAAERNEKLGVTPSQASAMHHGSMFGWFTLAADPDHEVNNPTRIPKGAR